MAKIDEYEIHNDIMYLADAKALHDRALRVEAIAALAIVGCHSSTPEGHALSARHAVDLAERVVAEIDARHTEARMRAAEAAMARIEARKAREG